MPKIIKKKPVLEIRNLAVHRNGNRVLSVDQLRVHEGEILVVIGPNGAGKSTLLLAISRLLKYSEGEVILDGEVITSRNDLDYRRNIAIVLQDPLLLDATVFNNVANGLRFRRVPNKEIKSRVNHWLHKLGVIHLLNRPARNLSGGESQRVSLARALALNPKVILMDEPFGALDSPTRDQLLIEFKSLLEDVKMTAVFITHDMNEALLMADRIAVILDGRLRQIGSPEEVFNNPTDVEVAALVGVETVLSGRVVWVGSDRVIVEVSGIRLDVVGSANLDQEVLLLLRPEDITLWADNSLPDSSARNRLSGTINRLISQGPLMKVVVECQDKNRPECLRVVALITRSSATEMGLAEDMMVSMTFKASAVHLIPR